MNKKDFFLSMKEDPTLLRSFIHDPLTTLKAHGVDPATVDTSLIPHNVPKAFTQDIGQGTGTAIAGAAAAAIG